MMVVTIAHRETDDEIWDGARNSLRSQLATALDWSQLGKRVGDCRFVVDQWTKRPALAPFIDQSRIGVAGHSYGALTAQALAGQYQGGTQAYVDRRIHAAIALSPGALSVAAAKNASGIAIPFFCVTGDLDGYVEVGSGADSMRLGVPQQNRIAIYEALPPGAKHLLVLKGADHMSFAGEMLEPERFGRSGKNKPQEDVVHWRKVRDVTTLFWQHYFGGGSGLELTEFQNRSRKILEEPDQFRSG